MPGAQGLVGAGFLPVVIASALSNAWSDDASSGMPRAAALCILWFAVVSYTGVIQAVPWIRG